MIGTNLIYRLRYTSMHSSLMFRDDSVVVFLGFSNSDRSDHTKSCPILMAGGSTLLAVNPKMQGGEFRRPKQTVFFAPRLRQNPKPPFQYSMMEDLLPGAIDEVELFARKGNLRRTWLAVGDEV